MESIVSPPAMALSARSHWVEQLKGGKIESFLYASNDSGHTWELRGRLSNLRS